MNRKELAARFGVSEWTVEKYVRLGIVPRPEPPRGPLASYGLKHIEAMEAVWGRNGLKDTNRTLRDWAEHVAYSEGRMQA